MHDIFYVNYSLCISRVDAHNAILIKTRHTAAQQRYLRFVKYNQFIIHVSSHNMWECIGSQLFKMYKKSQFHLCQSSEDC